MSISLVHHPNVMWVVVVLFTSKINLEISGKSRIFMGTINKPISDSITSRRMKIRRARYLSHTYGVVYNPLLMSLKNEITEKVDEIVNTSFQIEDISYVPEIDDTKLTFGNKALKLETTVLYIDLRDSTKILNNHNKATIAKIHKAYLYTTVKIAKSLGGEVRSFNGDSVLAFFQGTTKNTLSNAVKAAMKIKYMITHYESGINSLLKKYSAVDFGIGIDDGKVLCSKVGVGGDANTRDLIWIGNAVNKSVIISDECSVEEHIGISAYVYDNLTDDVKYDVITDPWGGKSKHDIWKRYTVLYNGSYEDFYKTHYYWEVR